MRRRRSYGRRRVSRIVRRRPRRMVGRRRRVRPLRVGFRM